ncbi:MAG: ABC transporter permease [Actinomycetota bacterium]|nr:ABC transporter permease [Actinomycetota bacterium]
MATLRFVLKRLVAQRLLGLAMVVTLAFSIGVLVAGPIYADSSREAILSSQIHTSDVTVKNMRVTKFGSGSFPYADADKDLRQSLRGIPVAQLVRQGLSNMRLSARGRSGSFQLLFRDGAARHLPLKGAAPVGPNQIALPNGIARQLGLKVGDTLIASGASGAKVAMQVTGIYTPPTPSDFWFGSLNPFPAPDSTQLPPSIVDRTGFLALSQRLDLTSKLVWDVYLDFSGMSFAQAVPVANRIQRLAFPDESPLAGVGKTTEFPTLLTIVEQRTANLRIPVYLVVFQIGAVALAVLAGVASLALTRQSFELAVLRSRGFTRGKLLFAQAGQTVVTAILGYPLGLLIGMFLARLATHANGPAPPGTIYPIRLSLPSFLAGAIGALAGIAILLVLSLPVISRTIIEERRLLSREARPLLARYPIELFILPLGIAAFYEVKTRGFLPISQSGSLDPLVVLAPTLLLFAASFIALRLLLFVLRRMEGLIGRTRALPAYLAGRRLARSPGTSFAISLLLVLAIGLLVVSTSYRATIIRNHQDSAHQDLGADWQVAVAAPQQQLSAIDSMPPGTTPVIRTDPDFEQGSFTPPPVALAIDPATYADGGWWRSDYARISESDILSRLSAPIPGLRLPRGAQDLQLTVGATKVVNGLALEATLLQPDGTVRTVTFEAEGGPGLRPGTATYSAGVAGSSRLLAIVVLEAGVSQNEQPVRLTVTDAHLVGGGGQPALDLAQWNTLEWRGSSGHVSTSGDAVTVSIGRGVGHVLGGIIPPEPPLPAMVSPAVAAQEGGQFDVTLGGATVHLRVVAQARGFPSALGDFLIVPIRPLVVDMERVGEPALAVNEVWGMGDDPRPALRAAGFSPGQASNAASEVALLSQLPQSLAVGMHFTAAAGGMALVVIGVSVGLYFTQRRREFEFASLRAMGSKSRQVAGTLITEQGAMIAFAVVAGAGLGFAVVRLMMPYFGKAVGAAFPAPVLVVDWRWLAIYGAAIAAATVLGLTLALRTLLRSSVTGVLRGEAE